MAGGVGVEPLAPGPPRRGVDGEALAARLEEIGAAAGSPVEALEPALHAILETTGVAAGAICLYDPRREVLRLAAEAGLSDEGCRRLRTVRRGDVAGWDMPLHSLLNRRVYLIESASKNRYVPPLVDASVVVRTIACLPLHAGAAPVGSLIVVTRMPQSLSERDIRALEPPMRQLGKIIEAVRRAASERAVPPAAIPPVTTPPRATGRTAAARRREPADDGRAARLEQECARLAAQVEELRARLAEAEAGAAHEQRAREELETALQRGAGSGQQELHTALEAARRAEAARAVLAAENAGLAAQLERLRDGSAPIDVDVNAEIDRLRARLAEAEAGAAHEQRVREQLQIALERGSSSNQQELRQALEAARRAEAARSVLASENARLAAELERWQAAAADDERSADQAAEIDRLRARLAEAEAGAAHEQRAREQLEAAHERGSSATQEELRHAHEAARHAEAARVALAAEHAALRAEAHKSAAQAESIAAELARVDQERGRLAAALEAASTGAGTALARDQAAEIERLRARLVEAESGSRAAGDAAEALAAAEMARDTAVRELVAAREQLAAARDEFARAHAEAEAHGHDLNIRLTEREQEMQTLRAERAADAEAAAARHEELAVGSDRLRALVATVEAERDRLAADAEGAAAARARLEAALATGLEEARGRDREVSARLTAREHELEALRAQTASEAAAARERIDALTAEGDQLRETIAAAEAERERLAAELSGAGAARARLEEALERGLEEARTREHDVAARLEEAQHDLDTLRADRTAEATAAAERMDAIATECEQLRAAVGTLETERDRLTAELHGAAAARARLEDELARGHTPVEAAPEPASEPEAVAAPGPEQEPVAPPAVAAEPSAARPSSPPLAADDRGTPLMVVLDTDASWTGVHVPGHELAVAAPDGDVAAHLGRVPARIVVNLASKGALDAIATLREAGISVPTVGCIADAGAGRALPLGLIDVVPRPLDPDMVLVALAGRPARTTRVVTVGDDVDAFVSLRQALAREGMSVSMAWNAKQAAELLPMVRPTVVVLDLDLPGRDAAGIVAQLGACEPIPTLVLIAPSGDSAANFAAVLGDVSQAHRTIALPALLGSVARSGS